MIQADGCALPVGSLALAVAVLCALSVVVHPRHAESSPLWEYAGDASSGQAFSGRLTAGDGAAVYYNPARLAGLSQSADITTSVLAGRLDIQLHDRAGDVDISEAIYDARIEDEQGARRRPDHRPLPTEQLPRDRGSADPSFTRPYLTTSTVIPVIEQRWTVGMYATFSTDQFSEQRPHFVDEREQYFSNSLHFERLGDRMVGAHVALGTGVKVVEGLNLGAGVVMGQDAVSDNEMFTPDPTDPQRSDTNTAVQVQTRFVPHFGVDATPAENWTMSATVHPPFGNRVDGRGTIRFWDFPVSDDDAVRQDLSYLYDYLPWRVGGGVQWGRDVGAQRIEAGAHLLYEHWSQYVDRQGEMPLDSWHNVVTPTVSLAWSDDIQTVSGDVQFAPSPVPEQDGRSNYVDNSRWALSAGFTRQFELGEMPLEVGLQTQLQWLMEQRAEKLREATDPVFDEFPESVHVDDGETIEESRDFRTNNPGYPGFRASGVLFGAGVTLTTNF